MQTITNVRHAAEGWERSLYAFLAEKERRSGSRRTVVGYSRMLQHFFGTVGKPPDRVTSAEVLGARDAHVADRLIISTKTVAHPPRSS